MNKNKLVRYKQIVENKYLVYNSLFLNLPYDEIEKTGILIPLLAAECEEGYEKNLNPSEIMTGFFNKMGLNTSKAQLNFLFKLIQYVERQVVLFDAVEDARFMGRDKDEIRPLLNLLQNASESDYNKFVDKLNDFSVRIVFTAHPTQFYPIWVLDIISDLREGIFNNNIEGVNESLVQLGMTSFLQKEKPSPLDEARNIIYYLRNVYYHAVGNFLVDLKNLIGDDFKNKQVLQLGFWPGGDRDGNPFVTAEISLKVADELRMTLYKCYYHDVKALKKRLSFRGVAEILEELRLKLYKAMFDSDTHLSWKEIHDDVKNCKQILADKYHGYFMEYLDRFELKLLNFKSHFAILDIRQDHSVHYSLMQEIFKQNELGDPDFSNWDEQDLIQKLNSTSLKLDVDSFEDPVHKDCIQMIRDLAVIQQKNGVEACHRYIISNSEDVFSVLFVYSLFRWCGWKAENIPVDIVPLFETMIGMGASESVMRKLFELEFYRSHIDRRGQCQTIMLGFSDGTKDGGYMRANWSIYKTKESLTALCREFDIDVIFFDGRGGPPARGGGKTQRFYASAGSDIASKQIQLTIQGQTITSTYGTCEQFLYNCEQLICAGLGKALISEDQRTVDDKQRELFERLAGISYEKYDALKNHDLFIPYLEEMSTLKYYSQAKIGSRPSKRGKSAQLTLKDLRAISFVGSWSQLRQNVPGYFGFGTALAKMKTEGLFDDLKDLYRDNKFFKALVLNSMMSIKKSYFSITSYMKKDERFSGFWQILKDEYNLSMELLLELTGHEILMEDEAITRRSIEMREKIVLPLITIQQYALQRISAGDDLEEEFRKIVTRSMYGNINASRNSA